MNIHELRLHHESSWRNSYPHFVKIVRARDFRVGVEVGVAFGGHAEALLEQTGITTLFGIDPYEHIEGYDDPMNLPQDVFENMCWYTIGRLSRFGRYSHVRQRSATAAMSAAGNCDFVYLDADHSYAGVLQDLQLWFPKVRPGGVIGGHDYDDADFPGVKQAVDQFCAQHGLHLNVEPFWVWWAEKK